MATPVRAKSFNDRAALRSEADARRKRVEHLVKIIDKAGAIHTQETHGPPPVVGD